MTSSWQHRGNNSDQVFWYTFGCQNKGKIQGNLSLGVFFLSIILAVQTGTPAPDISITGLSSINLALPWQPNACFSSWYTAACVTAWLNSNKRGQSSQKKPRRSEFHDQHRITRQWWPKVQTHRVTRHRSFRIDANHFCLLFFGTQTTVN